MRRRRPPLYIPPGGPLFFPNPELADDEGLIAIGGDLSPERLLLAYDEGIFPWFDEGLPPLWWSPDPRTVIEAADLVVSRSMRRFLRRHPYELSFDRAFPSVMRACGEREEGTWILPEMVDAYSELYRLGQAHSLEVWSGSALVGGIYGVQRGGLFAAESMFHRVPNASKLALIECVRRMAARGVVLFDVQFSTAHLSSLGARQIPRATYRARLARARHQAIDLSNLV